MEESTHGIFVFVEKMTLLLMGYSAMCQKMHGITFINTNDDDNLITDTCSTCTSAQTRKICLNTLPISGGKSR